MPSLQIENDQRTTDDRGKVGLPHLLLGISEGVINALDCMCRCRSREFNDCWSSRYRVYGLLSCFLGAAMPRGLTESQMGIGLSDSRSRPGEVYCNSCHRIRAVRKIVSRKWKNEKSLETVLITEQVLSCGHRKRLAQKHED